MTQSELAEKANLALRTVQSMEYGETFAGTTTLERLSAALNTPIAHFFVSKSDAEFKSFSLSAEFLTKLSALPWPAQQLAMAVVYEDPGQLAAISEKSARLLSQLLESLAAKPSR